MTNQPTWDEINKLREELIRVKYEQYRDYLVILDDEFLSYEFCDRIGNECGDLDWYWAHKGRGHIVVKLLDWCANALFDDPYFNPVNQEYVEQQKGA